jgi:hypothetical protein
MFPVPSNQQLSFLKIADYWSREMTPTANRNELFDFLAKAWWRGDLVASGAERVDVLKAIHIFPPSGIAFEADEGIKDLADGMVEIRRVVPLPKSNPDSWEESECTEAFQSIAQIWDTLTFELVASVVSGLELAEAEFTRWIASCGYERGTFWAIGEDTEDRIAADKISRSKLEVLAREYYEIASEGGRPTQSGFDRWLEVKDIHAPRGEVYSAYKKISGPLRRGRPTKKGPRDEMNG